MTLDPFAIFCLLFVAVCLWAATKFPPNED